MWGEFLAAEDRALSFLARFPDFLWGAVLALLCILAARLIFRAALRSCLGEEGSALAALAEILVALVVGLKLYQQPGAAFVLVGYFAAVARTFAPGL